MRIVAEIWIPRLFLLHGSTQPGHNQGVFFLLHNGIVLCWWPMLSHLPAKSVAPICTEPYCKAPKILQPLWYKMSSTLIVAKPIVKQPSSQVGCISPSLILDCCAMVCTFVSFRFPKVSLISLPHFLRETWFSWPVYARLFLHFELEDPYASESTFGLLPNSANVHFVVCIFCFVKHIVSVMINGEASIGLNNVTILFYFHGIFLTT